MLPTPSQPNSEMAEKADQSDQQKKVFWQKVLTSLTNRELFVVIQHARSNCISQLKLKDL